MKRWLILLFGLTLVLALAAACGESATPEATQTALGVCPTILEETTEPGR